MVGILTPVRMMRDMESCMDIYRDTTGPPHRKELSHLWSTSFFAEEKRHFFDSCS